MREFFIDMGVQIAVVCWFAATCVAAVTLAAYFR